MIFLAGITWSLFKILIYFSVFLHPISVLCFKLSAPVVLLPYNKGLPSNFTLEVAGTEPDDCFKWHSGNPDIVRVTPLFSEGEPASLCPDKVVISSIALLLERKVTTVSITGEKSNKTLLCDVITDDVHTIELESQTDELFLGGAPLKLSVVAKDKKGHTFSSINGLEIRWNVVEFGKKGAVRLSKYDESDYQESSSKGNELEKRGLFGPSLLVWPLEMGTADINASLLYSGYEVLHTEKLTLKILPGVPDEKLHPLSPSRLLLHSLTTVKFENEDVGPYPPYTVSVEFPEKVSYEEVSSQLRAKEYGGTGITLYNRKNEESRLEVAVVKLDRLVFRLSGGNYTTLEEMKIYEVFIDLVDKFGKQIHASDNLLLSVIFPPKLFHVLRTSSNGTYSVVETIAPGHGNIKVTFRGVEMENESVHQECSLSSSLAVTVSQKINIFPPFTLLPVLPELPMHKIPLTVSGGTRNYIWSISDKSAAKIVPVLDENNINSKIILEIYKEVHDLIVTVTDKRNINFIGKAKVSIQTPLDIEAYPSVTEAEVGNDLIIPVGLLGYEDKKKGIVRKFDDCSKANIKIDIVEKAVLSYQQEAEIPAFGKGCQSLQFRCKMSGHSRVNMEYTINPGKNNITYKTTTVLSCFKPLKPVYPVRVAVLPLGASMDIAFEGGPRRWPLFKEGHYKELHPSSPDMVKIQLIEDPFRYNKDLTVFRVLCKSLRENTLTLRVGNHPSATLKHPAKSETSIKLICSEPHSLHLKLFKKKTTKELKDDNIVKVPFYGEKAFTVDVYVKDSMGRRFANISTLRLAWSVSDTALAYPESEFDFETYENAVSGYRKLSRNFKEFKMRGGAGDLEIEAKITSYRKDVLTKEGISKYKELEEISRTIDLKLVSLRDINAGLYDATEEKKDEEGYCEGESCKS